MKQGRGKYVHTYVQKQKAPLGTIKSEFDVQVKLAKPEGPFPWIPIISMFLGLFSIIGLILYVIHYFISK